MKKLNILFILLFFIKTYGQQESTTPEKDFEKLRDTTVKLAEKNPSQTNDYTSELIRFTKNAKSEEKNAKALSTIAFIKFKQNKINEAINLIKQSLIINIKLKNNPEIAENYNLLGRIYEHRTNYVESTKYYLLSVDLAFKLNLDKILYKNYLGLGQINLVNRNYDKALNYFFKALELQKNSPNPENKAEVYISIGSCYTFIDNQKLAEKYFGEAFNYYNKEDKFFQMASILVERSNLYYESEPLKAIELQLNAQKLYDKVAPNSSNSAYNLAYLGESYFNLAKNDSLIYQIKNYEIPNTKEKLIPASESYYNKALEIFKKNKNAEWILTTSGLISDLQAYNGDYKNAYSNLLLSKKFNDSLFSQKNKNAIAKLESEKELLQLKPKRQKIQLKQNFNCFYNSVFISRFFGLSQF